MPSTAKTIIAIVAAIVLAIIMVTWVARPYSIPSGSMEQTLHVGDRVLVSKLSYSFGSTPHPGDIVVFRTPTSWLATGEQGEDVLIKRVIAVGGESVRGDVDGTIEVRPAGSTTWEPLDEPYVYQNYPAGHGAFPAIAVPPGRMWVMGDHRSDSADSLYHYLRDGSNPVDATVPYSAVIGKAVAGIWPLNRLQILGTPATFVTAGVAGGHPVPARVIGIGALVVLVLLSCACILYRRSGRRQDQRIDSAGSRDICATEHREDRRGLDPD